MSETAEGPSPMAARTEADTSVSDDWTTRDRVWDATLGLLYSRPIPFQAWRVRRRAGLGREHDRTIRRTLSVMAEAGWLEHEHNSKYWYPGPKAKKQFK